jgi:hypothetical protein
MDLQDDPHILFESITGVLIIEAILTKISLLEHSKHNLPWITIPLTRAEHDYLTSFFAKHLTDLISTEPS